MPPPKRSDAEAGAPADPSAARPGFDGPSAGGAPAAPPAGEREFDAWLREQLAGLHAAVLAEPVPERLLRVLGLGRDPAGR